MEDHRQVGLRCTRCPALVTAATPRKRFVPVLFMISGLNKHLPSEHCPEEESEDDNDEHIPSHSDYLSNRLGDELLQLGTLRGDFIAITFIQAAAAVNITSTLVLMTIMMTLRSSLPKSAPVTLLDIWMVSCLFFTAGILFCHIWIEFFLKEANHIHPNKVSSHITENMFSIQVTANPRSSEDFALRLAKANVIKFRVIPVAISIFIIVYFGIGVTLHFLTY